jgi:hypothetical protein
MEPFQAVGNWFAVQQAESEKVPGRPGAFLFLEWRDIDFPPGRALCYNRQTKQFTQFGE